MRLIRYAVAVILLSPFVVLAAPGVAVADPPETITVHQSFGPVTIIRTGACGRNPSLCLPCVPFDAVYAETVTVTETMHSTLQPDGLVGSVHLIGKVDLEEVPVDDPSLPTFTGHDLVSVHLTINRPVTTVTRTVTENIILNGSDGSHNTLHLTVHFTVNDPNHDGEGTFTADFGHAHNTQRCDGTVTHFRV
jgi:hypothetical protein